MRWSLQVIAIPLLGSAPAWADHGSIYATAAGDVAATDNVFAVASNANPQADVFFQVRPGILAAYDSQRVIQELTAQVEVLEYIIHSDSPSVTYRGAWKAFITPGPRSEVLLQADGGTGTVNAITARTSPDQTAVSVTPAGSTSLREASASESLSWQSTMDTRTSQTAFARWIATSDQLAMPTTTNSFEAGVLIGFERTFHHDTLGVDVGGSFLRLELIAPPTAAAGSRLDRQINPRASAIWRHDISKNWSTNLDAGIVYVNPIGVDPYNPMPADQGAQPYPIFGGILAYTDVWGHAALDIHRSVAPNLLIAENSVSDRAILQFALPLPWLDANPHTRDPKLAALASVGVERAQLVDPNTAALVGQFDIVHADVGLSWTPRAGQTYGLRYEFLYQRGDAAAQLVEPTFQRNTVFFTFALQYPSRLATQVPRRSSLRADRGDLAPVGAEPVVPDAAEPAPSAP